MGTIKRKTVLWSVIVLALSASLTMVQRKFFPDTEPVYVLDSTAIAQYEERIAIEKAYNIHKDIVIDSLNKALAKKPKIIIKKVPVNIFIKKDSIVYKDSVVHETIVVVDTLLKPIEVNEINNVIPDLNKEQYGADCYVSGNEKKGTTVKINKKYVKDKEVLYFVDGNTLGNSLVTFYNTKNIKRKLKFSQSNVYILITSYDEYVDRRLNYIVKNKNKM